MDPEEKSQVIQGTVKAMGMLRGSKKEHKSGINALIKLTGKKDYVELAAGKWLEEKGGAMTVDFLENCNLDDENLHELLEDHLRLVQNVVRVEKFVRPLVDVHLVDALLRMLGFCPVSGLITRCLKVIGLVSVDSLAVKQLIEGDAISEIMNHVTFRDESFLVSVLPRLIKDPKMTKLFCEHGGISYLQGVFVFEDETSMKALAGAVAAVSQLAKSPEFLGKLIAEEDFISCFALLISNPKLPPKVRVHVVRTLYAAGCDPVGFELVQPSVLTLIEVIEDRDPEVLPLAVACFDLLSLLCNTTESISLVEQFGGTSFIESLFCFLQSPKNAVVEPLCSLLHVLAMGEHQEMIIAALDKAIDDQVPQRNIIAATCDLIGGGKERLNRAVLRGSNQHTLDDDLGVVERPRRQPTISREAQTARQGAKRGNIIKEILSTERTYYAGLFSVCKCFHDPMKQMSGTKQALVSPADVEIIFGNLPEIYDLHKNFLKRIDQRVKKNPNPNIADLFSNLGDSLEAAYRPYFETYPRAVELIAAKEKKTKGFRVLCTDLTKKIVRGGMNLENYLIMPIQRLPRYAMLLRELEKATIDVHPDKAALGAAAAKMEEKLKALDSVIVNSKPVRKSSTSSAPSSRRASASGSSRTFGSSSGSSKDVRASSPAGLGASAERIGRSTSTASKQRSASAIVSGSSSPSTSKRSSTLKSTSTRASGSTSSRSSSRRNSSKRLSSGISSDDDLSSEDEGGQSYFSFEPMSGPSSRRSSSSLSSKRNTAALLKKLEKVVTDQERRESMVFHTSEISVHPLVQILPPAEIITENPILLEGYVLQKPGGMLRRMVLSKDRMVIFHVPDGSNTGAFVEQEDELFWEASSSAGSNRVSELPRALYSYQLGFLRFEREESTGLRLFDTRKEKHGGHVFFCESVQESNLWIDTLFEAIYPE